MSTQARQGLVVAIDGPAGAGKSTVAAHLARRFGLLNLETGAMYRALALKALRGGTDVNDGDAVLALTKTTRIVLQPQDGGNRVLLDGADVTGDLRVPEVTAAASYVSVHGPVREWMVTAQRALGRGSEAGVVMEGRDIGTVVFPNAAVKIFLDASVEARGDRRFAQQPAASESREAVLNDMRERDSRDRSRVQSPLRPADDALLLDTTGLSLDEVLARAEALVAQRLS
jgi:cytidylate kinase